MTSELNKSMTIANSGMKAQSKRLRVISENIANADSLPTKPGENPYRRKIVTFKNELNREMDAELVKVDDITTDRSEFIMKLDPSHPAADADGYVKTPNVNPIIEMMDMREAQRTYEANLKALENSRAMMKDTVGILGN